MERKYLHNDISTFERSIAKLYLFLLPVRMISPLLGFASLFHGAAQNFDFILNILGIAVYLIEHRFVLTISNTNSSDRAFKTFGLTACVLNSMSLVMAFLTQITKGSYAGETAFSGILGMEIYFFQYVLIIAYNRRVFHILSEDEIKRVLSCACWALMILGYYQALVLIFGGVFRSILESIDVCHILWPEKSMWKLSLTGREGASAGSIFAIFVLPFLLDCLLEDKKRITIIQIVFWIPLLIMMQSSSAYLMTAATLFGYLMCKFSGDKKKRTLAVFGGAVAVIIVILFGDVFLELLPQDVKYLMFEKALDMKNGSTVARVVPFVTNWKAFLQEPIIGVGNGLQGYYYVEYFPEWAKNVAGSDVMTFYNTAQKTIINGGLFFPGLLSGYGIVGLMLIFNIGRIIRGRLKEMKNAGCFAYNYFKIAVWAIVVCGFQSEFAGNYVIWFVLGLPFMDYTGGKRKDESFICNSSIARL